MWIENLSNSVAPKTFPLRGKVVCGSKPNEGRVTRSNSTTVNTLHRFSALTPALSRRERENTECA